MLFRSITGAIVNVVILLVGDMLYDKNKSVISAILGSVLAIVIGKVVEFFRFCVDYSRTEKVQFEDDEYYYYVKAIPKMTVAAQDKTIKKINTQRRPSQTVRTSSNTVAGHGEGTQRSVMTERLNVKRTAGSTQNNRHNSQSITIGQMSNELDEFEDLDS